MSLNWSAVATNQQIGLDLPLQCQQHEQVPLNIRRGCQISGNSNFWKIQSLRFLRGADWGIHAVRSARDMTCERRRRSFVISVDGLIRIACNLLMCHSYMQSHRNVFLPKRLPLLPGPSMTIDRALTLKFEYDFPGLKLPKEYCDDNSWYIYSIKTQL